MKKSEITEKFTEDDIHKLREYNAEKRKKLSVEEGIKNIRKKANECEKNINRYRKKDIAI